MSRRINFQSIESRYLVKPAQAKHVRVLGPTLEAEPADPTQLRQTAFCAWCAAHRPDEDPRWPCSSARAEIKIGQLLSAITRIAEEANAVSNEDSWGIYPMSLFRVIAHECAELREVLDLVEDQVLPDTNPNRSNEES